VAKPANPDEIKSFLEDGPPELPVLDRSTLEAWSTCPFQAHAISSGKVQITNTLMAAGEEVHQAISRTIQQWIDTDGMADQFGGVRGAIADWLEGELRGSRPDVQPEAIAGARASLWSITEFLVGIRPGNILCFDGGEDDRSSQLAMNLGFCTVTSELDLVTATESVEVLRVTDWKTGHTIHTAADAAHAFQPQMHADLLFEHYKGIEAVEFVFWDARRNKRTYKVLLPRSRREEYHSRVFQAAQSWQRYRDNPVPWPTIEKCELCRAAFLCPAADNLMKDATTEPGILLEQLIAAEQRVKVLKGALSGVVKATGAPVVSGSSAFGPHKKSERAPANQLYSIKAEEADDSSQPSE
jgi:hypothetical protein